MRGFAGVLSARLGYNGLPSVFSGLDESDSGTRKKYPFELEKAIHNVMFIQHHIQRQDQFNAVSKMKDIKDKLSSYIDNENISLSIH